MSNEKYLKKAVNRFFEHFSYFSKYPPHLNFDRKAFAEELDKCVEDDFDYTIKKYGAIPTKQLGLPKIIID